MAAFRELGEKLFYLALSPGRNEKGAASRGLKPDGAERR